MPGNLELGQVYSYPQRLWRKRRYQYLQYFMLPKHLRYEPETEFNTGLVGGAQETVGNNNEDSNGSNANSQEKVSSENQVGQVYQHVLNISFDKKDFLKALWCDTQRQIGLAPQYKRLLFLAPKVKLPLLKE